MKTIFAITISLLSSIAFATEAEFTACDDVQAMVVLAKDNMPYWAHQSAGKANVQSCYEAVKVLINEGTDADIAQFQAEFDNMHIAKNDAEFAGLIKTFRPQGNEFNAGNGHLSTLIPVIKPTQPGFFQKK